MSKRTTLVLAIVAVLLVPVAAFAADQFSDVPTGHTFHDEIGAVADAGITSGYPDGTFRPTNEVTRQAMAAFLERGVSHASSSTVGELQSTNLDDSDGRVEILTLDVEVPGESGGEQLVRLRGEASLYINEARSSACTGDQCNIHLELEDSTGAEIGEGAFTRIAGDYDGGTVTVTGLTTAPSGTTQTYSVVAETVRVQNEAAFVSEANMDAITLPMSAEPSS